MEVEVTSAETGAADGGMRIDYGEDEVDASQFSAHQVEDTDMIEEAASTDGIIQEDEAYMADAEPEPKTVDVAEGRSEEMHAEESVPFEHSVFGSVPSLPLLHPGFESPPLIQSSTDGLQISALGHSALSHFNEDSPSITGRPGVTPSPEGSSSIPNPPPAVANGHSKETSIKHEDEDGGSAKESIDETGSSHKANSTEPQSQQHKLDRKKALATQHQHSSDGSMQQNQSVETEGEHKTRITQGQSLEPGDSSDEAAQENEVVVRQETDSEGGDDHIEIETNQKSKGGKPNKDGQIKQINQVKVIKRGDDCASCTHSGGTMERPAISKDLLSVVEFPDDLETQAETFSSEGDGKEQGKDSEPLAAPVVLLTFKGKTYSLFRSYVDVSDPQLEIDGVLFSDRKYHDLYYGMIETFLGAIRDEFKLEEKEEEIALNFDQIGLVLPEDNVYTREVCLYDFDRIHVGCALAGRLHVFIEMQARFPTGFNALAKHIKNIHTTRDDDELQSVEEGEEETIDLKEPESTGADEKEVEDGVEKDEIVPDGEWAEGDFEVYDEDAEGEEEEEEEEEGEVEITLEEALAELDGDDLTVLIEGIQEDLHSETETAAVSHLPKDNTSQDVLPEGKVDVDSVLAKEGGTVSGDELAKNEKQQIASERSSTTYNSETVTPSAEGTALSTAEEEGGGGNALAIIDQSSKPVATEIEEPLEDDVVIDYDEVFESAPSQVVKNSSNVTKPENDSGHEAKRTREGNLEEAVDDEHSPAESKRLRIDEAKDVAG